MESENKKTNNCNSCYAAVKQPFKYCYACNKKRDDFKRCQQIKKNGDQCKLMVLGEYCFYHKKNV